MRIWLCPSAFFPLRGGVEELTLKLAQNLARDGHSVIVVTHAEGDSLVSDEVEGIAVRRLAFSSPSKSVSASRRFLTGFSHLQSALSDLPKPDLVHVQCPSNQTAALLWWATRHKLPLVVTSQGETVMDANHIYQRSAYLRTVLRASTRQAAALTACSRWTADQASSIAPRFAGADVIFNGVDSVDWQLPAATDRPVLCAWGRHVPQKGFDLLLAAFDVFKQQAPTAELLIGGDGPETEKLHNMAGEGVTFLGSLSRSGVASMLSRSRVAVVPSRIEPFGIVALEALAAGRQLVYSTHGGLAEAAGGLGLAADPFDRHQFADVLARAVASDIDVDGGLARAAELSWARMTDRYLAVYQRVLG